MALRWLGPGLFLATLATLLVLPAIFALVQRYASTGSASLDPGDPESPLHTPEPTTLAAE